MELSTPYGVFVNANSRLQMQVISTGYLFVDNARFLSILSIVLFHSELFERKFTFLEGLIVQFRAFGVLTFFVITAFLMASKFSGSGVGRLQYWKNRLDRVGKPWLVWVGIYIALDLSKLFALHKLSLSDLPTQLFFDIFYTAYWYVPVLMFSLAVLLAFRRYWNSPGFAAVLLGVSLIHGVNQYYRWFPHTHSVAFFGYLFYLWLGVRLYQNFSAVQAFIARISWRILWGAMALAYLISVGEAQLIFRVGYQDAYNALKLSNQLYALVVLAVLIKLPLRLVPNFIQVRKESYGIYLTHLVVASVGIGIFDLILFLFTSDKSFSFFNRLPEVVINPWERVVIWFTWFTVVYTLSLLLTKALRQTRLAWIVGDRE